jgi:hypothetical protein
MSQTMTADDSTELKEVDADTLFSVLSVQADSETQTLPEDARFEIRVQYEPKQGKADTLTKSGEVWGVHSGPFQDEIKFSMFPGEEREDSFMLKIRSGRVELVSFSDCGNKTDLGSVQSLKVQQ